MYFVVLEKGKLLVDLVDWVIDWPGLRARLYIFGA